MAKKQPNKEIVESSVSELIPDDKNFNKGTEFGAHLMDKSFRHYGAGRSILLDKNNRVIAGNKSLQTFADIGLDKVRIIETTGDELIAVKRIDVDLDTKRGREMALADNATSRANLEWDESMLKSVADEMEIGVADWGIELNEDLIEEEPADVQEDDFDESTDKVESKVQLGDIWQLGDHRLMCGDSTNEDDITKLMNGDSADLWLTDPPYNVNYEGKTSEALKISNDSMSSSAFYDFLHSAFKCAEGVMKAGSSFYIWFASREHINFESSLQAVGLSVREELIWVKNTLVMSRQDYHWKHEPCLYGWKEGAGHNWYSDRKQTTCLEFDRPTRSEFHPTMKPIPLFAYQMQNSSKKGDIVLDTFGGSGTTLIAAEQIGRKCRMMELDPHYCDVIIARWEKLTGQTAVKSE